MELITLLKTGTFRFALTHKAAELGNQKVIDNLIKYGLTMNTRNEKGITPQMIFDRKTLETPT